MSDCADPTWCALCLDDIATHWTKDGQYGFCSLCWKTRQDDIVVFLRRKRNPFRGY